MSEHSHQCQVTLYPDSHSHKKHHHTERLLKHYPPTAEYYPGWHWIIQPDQLVSDNKAMMNQATGWNDGEKGMLCLKVDVVANRLYLGHVSEVLENKVFCKANPDEDVSGYSEKRMKWNDFMMLRKGSYEWQPVNSTSHSQWVNRPASPSNQ